jgi:uncharacterized membrane-anchored protein
MKFKCDPQRDLVWHELHARPYVRFSAPAHVFHFASLITDESEAAKDSTFIQLKKALDLQTTYDTPRHAIGAVSIPGLGRLVVAWEHHSEYVACTFYLYDLEIPFEPFGVELDTILRGASLEQFMAAPLVATRLAIGKFEMAQFPDALVGLFEGHTINGSEVMGGRAQAFSSYCIHGDGFGRIVLAVNEMSPHDLGRTVERLLVIEDAYHLMLARLPLARQTKADLTRWEDRMVQEMDALRAADSLERKRSVLDSLLGMAAEVENLRARDSNQFAGAAAYFSLLEGRFNELREGKLEHVLRLSSYLVRRLAPAERTYQSVLERLRNLSERISRAASLLRTGIELAVEEQNQRLLESVNRRARLQIEIQHAIESLSVIVLTYYSVGLLEHVLKAADSAGMNVHVEPAIGIATPILLLIFWMLMRLIRRRFQPTPH